MTDPTDLKYDANGLIPVIVQDDVSGDVLMLAYMNQESLRRTVETGETWFWSRSRQEFWHKGETSGHIQRVRGIFVNEYDNSLLVRVEQVGGTACHLGYKSCFHRRLVDGEWKVIAPRLVEPDT